VIEIAGLVAGYGRIRILDRVALSLSPGECVGILGHNGMGKSTLLKTVAGLLPVWQGTIRLDGRAIERDPPHVRARRGIGYVPQGRQIFPGLDTRENLRFAAIAKGLDPVQSLRETLALFPELAPLLDRRGAALSGGEQQLLALARAWCGRPRLLLLDEPSEGIQPSIVAAMIDRVRELRRRHGLAVLLVEQNLDFIGALAERILLIHRGRILREMSREAFLDPAVEREFIGLGPESPTAAASTIDTIL
jgi:ABC-type branched-subunit amino acid transport system ATPase component